jgi:hypothetical protein
MAYDPVMNSAAEMLDFDEVDQLARKAAEPILGKDRVENVASSDTTDSDGRLAIRIEIQLAAGSVASLNGDAPLDALVAMRNALSGAGEERAIIVEYSETGEDIEEDEAHVGGA